jgi:uncharacterized protein YciI
MHRLALILVSIAAFPSLVHPTEAIKNIEVKEPPTSQYVLGLLSRGDAWTPERNARIDSLQAGHMANMQRRYEEGWLIGAGPVLDPASSLRGLFFFKADSVAQVEPLVATDPAIAAGRLRIELVRWRAKPGIGDDYKNERRMNPSLPDSMLRYVVGIIDPAATGLPAEAANSAITSLEKSKYAILSGSPLDERGRRLVVFATADTAKARAWVNEYHFANGRLRLPADLRPWMVARGVIPGH